MKALLAGAALAALLLSTAAAADLDYAAAQADLIESNRTECAIRARQMRAVAATLPPPAGGPNMLRDVELRGFIGCVGPADRVAEALIDEIATGVVQKPRMKWCIEHMALPTADTDMIRTMPTTVRLHSCVHGAPP